MAYRANILINRDAAGAEAVYKAFLEALQDVALRDEVQVWMTSSVSTSAQGVEAIVYPDSVRYVNLTPEDAVRITEEHLLKGRPVLALTQAEPKVTPLPPPAPKEVRVVLRNVGKINPFDIEDYIAEDGYAALAKVLTTMTPEQVLDVMKTSGLRGRGGAGFPTHLKWTFARNSPTHPKYIICNGDEGDPGAFMNRSVLEGDPHAVIEGMIIAAYVIGAEQGYFYVRAEYPIAIRTLRVALQQAREYGFLGKNIFGSGFDFDLEIRMGAGAFVCGEETALMRSIEGQRGMPSTRPPFPAVAGLWQRPTNINNVETYANVPQILLKGGAWFASMGTEKSKGTKTFAIAGKVKRTGLIEVPLGVTLREIVYDIGGGILNDKKFKAVQTGGPMGGCIPTKYLDMPIDYESLASVGSIMGSGGFVVMDEDTCMVDIARFFMDFAQEESCGKCVPCRVGTRRMLDILNNICAGRGKPGDIEMLQTLGRSTSNGALCGLGKGAPNPVLSTIEHFRAEYEAHIYEKKCPAKVCRALIEYKVDPDLCIGCTRCARNCPVNAIAGKPKEKHVIDPNVCIRCGICKQVCPVNAISIY
ncbi:MAG TPA: NADH-ubiquinone oxidoreductase-F iron-sulfur binding region domain-containing protein [Anaerolineae bacterium]|nr:NADH-ubiquinone oxidoreductase-F iron-sulfur binding region domain-containing protein [Anaerolineae bacterium]HQH37718.1 NADH-ubiquinone oxidoreductase-F iron-sulfur binding region domain-containing protein [Anaerolineae bacterium]